MILDGAIRLPLELDLLEATGGDALKFDRNNDLAPAFPLDFAREKIADPRYMHQTRNATRDY